MTSLTDIAFYLRRVILFGSIGFIVLIVVTLSTMNYLRNTKRNIPIPTPTPSTSFGPLPQIIFPQPAQRPTSFDLQLIEGKPPEATASAVVYLIPDKKPTLFSKRQGLIFGKKLGFLEEPIETSDTVLQFTDPSTGSKLTVNTATNNFFLTKKYTDPLVFQNLTITDQQQARSLAQAYFNELRVWNSRLDISTISFYSYANSAVQKLPDERGANLVRVDFFESHFGPYPTVTNLFSQSGTYLVFTIVDRKVGLVYEASFNFFPADANISATYPTISGNEAWDKLKAGNGYIASPAPDGKAIVRRVYLSFYEPHEYMPFLQPVWAFTGDKGFAAYVPAIKEGWVGN